MSDTLITIIAIFLAAILMFVFPLITMADRTDDVTQLSVQTATTEFVEDIRTTGRITLDKYEKFVQELAATGNAYDVEMEVQVLDENPGKKTSQANSKKIGENVYYSMYTSQILEQLGDASSNRILALKEGDIVSTSVKSISPTLWQQLNNFFYSVTGNNTHAIVSEHSVVVTTNGAK